MNTIPKELLQFPHVARRLSTEEAREMLASFARFCNIARCQGRPITILHVAEILEGILREHAAGATMVRRPYTFVEAPTQRDTILGFLSSYARAPDQPWHHILIGSDRSGLVNDSGYRPKRTILFRLMTGNPVIMNEKIFIFFQWR